MRIVGEKTKDSGGSKFLASDVQMILGVPVSLRINPPSIRKRS